MRQHPDRARRYAESAIPLIGPPYLERIVRRTVLEVSAVRDAVLMGPNARHVGQLAPHAEFLPTAVTFDVELLFARKRRAGTGSRRAC
jgi:hypothetical protein